MDSKFEYVEPDDPTRCQAVHARGQCRYKSVPESKYCRMHGGNRTEGTLAEKVKRQYQFAKWQEQVDGFADEDAAKSLRAEIGISRLLLQEVMNKCKTGGDLIMYSGKMGDLITRIEKLVSSSHRLETSLGNTLDKTKVLDLAAQMVEIIGKHVTDDAIIQAISVDIVQMVLTTTGDSNGSRT